MAPELREALADDLGALIRLHDRELDAATVAALKATEFPEGLALLPVDEAGQVAWAGLRAAVQALPSEGAGLDQLAADYAAIYLNNRYGASPYESVWLDEDQLVCQQPMFELRALYAAAGLRVETGEVRHDDHLVLQLHYLRHGFARPETDLVALAGFLDEHIGYWLPEFARRLARFAETEFYAGLALITAGWLAHCRVLLADLVAVPVPAREVVGEKIRRKLALDKAEVAPIRFLPGGGGPSW